MHRLLSKALGKRVPSPPLGPVLTQRTAYFDSQATEELLGRGHLEVRNSDTLELKLYRVDRQNRSIQPVSIQVGAHSNLQELYTNVENELPLKGLKFLSEENVPISSLTPVEAFLNRSFTLISENDRITIEGQFLHPDLSLTKQAWKESLRESLKQIEQPIFIQRQIEHYLHRVDTWLDAKYGLNTHHLKMKTAEVQDILLQALKDPECEWGQIRELQNQWRNLYFEVELLRKKFEEAVEVSRKKARNRMYVDLGLIMCNIGFIGGGTYFVYSWDIIEPWAYFISSAASIYLFRKAGQFRKPFSLDNYRSYLIYEVYLQRAAHEVGLDLEAFREKQKELQIVESTFKDCLITKL